MVVTALLALTFGFVSPVDAATTVLRSGTLDAANTAAPRWERTDFTPTTSGLHTFVVDFTEPGFAHARLKDTATRTNLAIADDRNGPLRLEAELTAGTAYYLGVWNSEGIVDYSLTVDAPDTNPPPPPPPPPPPAASETVLGETTVDEDGAVAPVWSPIRFRPEQSGTQTVILRWNGSADINVRVKNLATGEFLADRAGSNGELRFPVDLAAEKPHWFGVRADRGVATVTASVVTDGTPPPATTTTTTTVPPAEDGRPNIVVINTDDQRADSLSFLPKIRSWLGDGGRTYTNALVTTPSCCPSRASLLSGQYVHNHGVITQLTPALDPDHTVQHYLRDAGYFTGHSGKYLHYIGLGEDVPHWDRWTYFRGGFVDVQMNFDGRVNRRPGYTTTITFDRAIEYVDQWSSVDDDRPFYLHITPVAPHSPYIPEAKYANASVPPVEITPALTETDRSDKPRFVRNQNNTYQDQAEIRTQRIRTLYSVDDQVDRLMRYLADTGEIDNTLVIFTSDNGYLLGEHDLTSKFLPYSPAVDVPLLVRWPGQIPGGSVSNDLVANIDIAPTVLRAAGVNAEHVMDGIDLLSSAPRSRILTEYFYDTRNSPGIVGWASNTTMTDRYNEYYDPDTGAVVFREYYDLTNDPYELVNLLEDGNPGNDPDVASYSARLQADRNCTGSACP